MPPIELSGSDRLTALKRVLGENAVRVCQDHGLLCRIAGKPAIPSNALYSDFWFRLGITKQIEKKGERLEVTVALIQFALYEPADYDDKLTMKIAKHVIRAFTRKEWAVLPDSRIVTHKMGISVLTKAPPRNRAVVIVDGSFEYIGPAA